MSRLMHKFLQHMWLSCSAILAFWLILPNPASAGGLETTEAGTPPAVPAIAQQTSPATAEIDATSSPSVTSIERMGEDSADNNALSEITSVSQLSDVQPSDWAYQALRSLQERYGCISGFQDGSFRGNQAMTRYEFAAALNACLDKIAPTIGTGKSDQPSQEDLATLQKLKDEFANELSALRRRIETLDARTLQLEANQFSTTTKLNGFTSFNITDATAAGSVRAEGLNAFVAPPPRRPPRIIEDDPNVTLSGETLLTLNTSFTGRDRLVTKLLVGTGNSPVNQLVSAGLFNTTGVPFTDQSGGPTPNKVVLNEFFYSFPVSKNVRVIFGPRVTFFIHFDANPFTFPLRSTFNSANGTLLTSTRFGAGAVVEWRINKQFELHTGYLAQNMESSQMIGQAVDPSKGLFNGTNTLTAELTYKPASNANIRLLYQRSNLTPNQFGQINFPPIVGVADDGLGGQLNAATADTFGLNFDWFLSRSFGIFGRYYYGSTHLDPRTAGLPRGNVNAQTFQLGLGFPGLGKQGALGTLSFLVPFDVRDGRNFLASGGGNGGTQYEIEANYSYPLTSSISLVPGFYVIKNINNFSDNPTVFVGTMRSQFLF